mmetsp:Transcript_9301/g.21848  ORF Transcript_9301/g.21848 Transcript_9301/m.21848 type:complete len:536 (-) Transcript_9301:187-1794(-)
MALRARTSIHLEDKELLRGTTLAVLLSGFGRRMRGTAGGIGHVAESADDAYAKSLPVDELQIFLSHSWHTWWFLKYLTLLYYFNAVPAVSLTFLASVCFTTYLWQSGCGEEQSGHGADFDPGIRPWCQVIGSVVFIATLLTWHHVVAALRIGPRIFLDKVCIHQTDSALKLKGIKSIGAILANSKMMLVTWDRTYFERLWCTYEMSAFRKGNPQGKITILPVVLGAFVLSYSVATSVADIGLQGFEKTGALTNRYNLYLLSAVLHWPMFILSMRFLVRYINNLKKLKKQLEAFRVQSARCFCCSVGHEHPETKARLPCDREVVEDSIESWMGLETFNKMVQTDFKHFVKRTLGGRAKIPYRYALAASIFPGLAGVDHMTHEKKLNCISKATFPIDSTFLRHPLIIATAVAFYSHYQECLEGCLRASLGRVGLVGYTKYALYFVSGSALTALYYVTLSIKDLAWQRPVLQVSWLVVELVGVTYFYCGKVIKDHVLGSSDSMIDGNRSTVSTESSTRSTRYSVRGSAVEMHRFTQAS